MMKGRTHLISLSMIIASLSFQGCAFFSKRDSVLANPVPLHKQGDAPVPPDPKNPEHGAIAAYSELSILYYRTLAEAQKPKADQQTIDAYVKAGTAVVELECLRWFGHVADAQRGLMYSDSSWNVIRQLGTTLIGIAKLHPDVTAVYGAGNTAWEGFRNNLNSTFLAAPSAESVKKLTLQAVKARSDVLNDSRCAIHPKDFPTAYLELEKLADTCTYSEIRKLTTQAVTQSQGRADPTTGETSVVPSAEAAFLKDDEGDALREFWKPDGRTPDPEAAKKIREWMGKNNLDPRSITFFMRGKEFAPQRRQAVRELGLDDLTMTSTTQCSKER